MAAHPEFQNSKDLVMLSGHKLQDVSQRILTTPQAKCAIMYLRFQGCFLVFSDVCTVPRPRSVKMFAICEMDHFLWSVGCWQKW